MTADDQRIRVYWTAQQQEWIARIKETQTAFIVVAGLVLTSAFSALTSYDDDKTCPGNQPTVRRKWCSQRRTELNRRRGSVTEGICGPAMWFRALGSLAFCAAAFAIHVSAIILTAVSTIEPRYADNVKDDFVRHLGWLVHLCVNSLSLSVIATLAAVAVAPFSIVVKYTTASTMVPSILVAALVVGTLSAFFCVFCEARVKLFGIGKHAACCGTHKHYRWNLKSFSPASRNGVDTLSIHNTSVNWCSCCCVRRRGTPLLLLLKLTRVSQTSQMPLPKLLAKPELLLAAP